MADHDPYIRESAVPILLAIVVLAALVYGWYALEGWERKTEPRDLAKWPRYETVYGPEPEEQF